MTHRYSIGQTVYFTPQFRGGSASGTYKIVRLLPIENDSRLRYRIKNATESFERVAEEVQLSRTI